MDLQFYRLHNKTIHLLDSPLTVEQWNDEDTCIELRVKTRKEAADYFEQLSMFEGCRDYIEHPENYPPANRMIDYTIVSLVASDHKNLYKEDYISMVIKEKMVIVVINDKTELLRPNTLPLAQERLFEEFIYSLFYFIAANLLAESNANMLKARRKVQQTENLLSTSPEEVEPEDIMRLVRDINSLADIIEDQGIDANFIISLAGGSGPKHDLSLLRDLVSSFVPLDKSMVRLVEKAESLRLQYLLIQQEKSSRKINFLTIVQSVFVPLTFIAGIYGMNFKLMPELDWQYGYMITWGIMIFISGGLLTYFYKNGWFE